MIWRPRSWVEYLFCAAVTVCAFCGLVVVGLLPGNPR